MAGRAILFASIRQPKTIPFLINERLWKTDGEACDDAGWVSSVGSRLLKLRGHPSYRQ